MNEYLIVALDNNTGTYDNLYYIADTIKEAVDEFNNDYKYKTLINIIKYI